MELLESSNRESEVIVCSPFRPTTQWFKKLKELSDDMIKLMAGKLSKVANDAPDRVSEWPVVVFHISSPVTYVSPLLRLPKWLRDSHKRWGPGYFTSGTWSHSGQSRAGIQAMVIQFRAAARALVGTQNWIRRARAALRQSGSTGNEQASSAGTFAEIG